LRKLFIPEVVQTSSLDCGPACLKAFLEGFGRHVSYGKLRDACQTGLDGTSIDTIEVIANQFGLEAERIMLPLDHLLLAEARALPAIVVVTLSQGVTHFVVVWNRIANWLQIMDPSVGRRWVRAKTFLNDVYQHTISVNAADWLEFAASDDFQCVFQARQKAIGITLSGNQPNAEQDAAVRLTQSLVASGSVSQGPQAQQLAERLLEQPHLIPRAYWSVTDSSVPEQILMRGAVLVRARSQPGLSTVAHEPRTFKFYHPILSLLLCAMLAASAGAFAEALLFRGLLDINTNLALVGQRIGAITAILVFCFALLLLEFPLFATGARLGRLLENRFRVAFLEKLPRLSERYFQSRPVSDMAERSHIMHRLRHLPDQARQLLIAMLQLVLTAAAIVWLDHEAWGPVFISLCAALIPLFSAHWLLAERDLRVRTHSGALMRFYLDAMLGLMPIRTHGAADSLRHQHSRLLSEWTSASYHLQRAVVLTEGVQLFIMFGAVAALLLLHPFPASQIGKVLLMAYWALNMPALGQQIAVIARQYSQYRSITLRLLELLDAPEELPTSSVELTEAASIEFKNVSVEVSGNHILSNVTLKIEAGSHVAIVGPSGAGKSSLVGLLLGWLTAASGTILVNQQPLQAGQLRRSTAWVDPGIQLWNQSLHANLEYGGEPRSDFAEVIDAAALRDVLRGLPQGLQTPLGENGGLLSGGEGQRVRFGRALQSRHAKLVILDEPFRGLDRQARRELLVRAREFWSNATLLCITHDLSETQTFDRVVVLENGTVMESNSPPNLLKMESRYSQLLASEEQARIQFWESSEWRRIELQSGHIVESEVAWSKAAAGR